MTTIYPYRNQRVKISGCLLYFNSFLHPPSINHLPQLELKLDFRVKLYRLWNLCLFLISGLPNLPNKEFLEAQLLCN